MSKDIYVIIEQRDTVVQKVALELLGEATRLAEGTDHKVIAVIAGYDITSQAELLIQYGADEVLCIDDPMLKEYVTEPYTKALTEMIQRCDPDIVLFGATAIGRDLAPRVAQRVHTGLTADCTSLAIGEEDGLLYMTRPAFGGNIMATILIRKYRPQMATVRPGVMKRLEKDASRKGEIKNFKVEFTPEDMNVEIVEVIKSTKKAVDITDAKILISGGRAVGGPEGFNPLRELATVIGGEVSGSRVTVDSRWFEKDRQVGQSGKTARPDLYMACGISGAIQHLAGMESSEYIVAINKDESAPIFDVADLGIVGDIKVIIPKLTEALKKFFEEKNAQ